VGCSSCQPSDSEVLVSNFVTDSIGYVGGERSVSRGSNSNVASAVLAGVLGWQRDVAGSEGGPGA
jgi:hypothetical protein